MSLSSSLLTEHKDSLVLRFKYHKTTFFVPCRPTTTLSALKQEFLSSVQQTNQMPLDSLPAYNTADGKTYPDWSSMDPDADIGLFVAGSNPAAGAAADDDAAASSLPPMTIYMPIDQDSARSEPTVGKAALKDADAVCVGFRANGASTISQPVVQFTDFEEEEEEEEEEDDDADGTEQDPDAIPPPLSE
ncbi:hypothetical protein BCV70DRAFT_185255 [Testicularia cyperi]|uniref:Uncharacterized protein n=1 Tax=Testicularia cyperi TaxID=1882483 RepID=A0A317Y2M2_9BASI|nr:hypothetical protein BCV70DRAFT_185255 [Testicularia cyperi]